MNDDTSTTHDTPDQQGQKRSSRRKLTPKMVFWGAVVFIAVITLATIAVQQLNNEKSAQSRALTTQVAHVSMTADGFVPANLQLAPDTLVVWTNKDTVSHEVQLLDKNAQSLDISQQLAPGETFSTVLDESKEYYMQTPNGKSSFQGLINVRNKANNNE